MSIYRTTDPTAFDDVDGIIINEFRALLLT